jgi:hypothetical protein
MTSKPSILTTAVIVLLSLAGAAHATEWQLAKQKNGVSVWTAPIDTQRVNLYRAETILDHPLNKVLAALREVGRYSEWMSDCHEGRVFAQSDASNYSTYMLWDLPFPFKDREFVQQVSIRELANGVEMSVSPIPDKLPINSKYVRVNSAQIQWVLTSLASNKTKAVQTGYADPAGRLPSSMINRFVENGPYQTMVELRDWLVKQEKLGLQSQR